MTKTKTTDMTPVGRVENTLAHMNTQFKSMLPAHISTRKFLRAAVTAVQSTPDLMAAEHDSIIASCQKAAADGLVLDGREASLVVFNKNVAPRGKAAKWEKHAQYMPMVAGILKKARNSGQISSISANVVYENDYFDYQLGLNEKLDHKPIMDGDAGDLKCAYAIAKLSDGSVQIEVMRKADIEKAMMSSKSGWDAEKEKPKGIWAKWESEMWRKTVLKRLCKYLPSSTDLDEIVNYDNETFGAPLPLDEKPVNEQPPAKAAPGNTKAASSILEQDKKSSNVDDKDAAVDGDIVQDDEAPI